MTETITTRADVEDSLILLAKTGSVLYGTNTPESDLDLQGAFIAPYSSYFYLEDNYPAGRELYKETSRRPSGDPVKELLDTCQDTTVYEIRDLLAQLMKANPNRVELLFLKDSDIIEVDGPIWEIILERKKFFLNRNVKKTYVMYAYSQLKRVTSHRKWLLNPVEEPKPEDYGIVTGIMSEDEIGAYFRLLHLLMKERIEYLSVIEGAEVFYKEKVDLYHLVKQSGDIPELDEFIKEVVGPFPNPLEAYKKAKEFYQAKQNYKSYLRWDKHRNPARKALEKKCGYDTKHLAHCLRLLYQGIQLIQEGTINVNISGESYYPFIRRVLEGRVPYSEVLNVAEDLFTLFKSLDVSHLPPPDDSLRVELLKVIHDNY